MGQCDQIRFERLCRETLDMMPYLSVDFFEFDDYVDPVIESRDQYSCVIYFGEELEKATVEVTMTRTGMRMNLDYVLRESIFQLVNKKITRLFNDKNRSSGPRDREADSMSKEITKLKKKIEDLEYHIKLLCPE